MLAWNDCPVFATFIPNRSRIMMFGVPTPANIFFDKWRATARRYGFREYDGPPLEPLELFTTKSGEEIVGQLYNFMDKGERRHFITAGDDPYPGAHGRRTRA